jgi:zinc protease
MPAVEEQMSRSRVLTAVLATLTLPMLLAAQPPSSILPFKASEKTLANGLKIIVVPTGFPNIVSVQIPVQTGSRNEVEPGKSGFAHFFEHMMFRGTDKYPPDVYNAIMTKAGARTNAYTSDDITNFHATFAKEDLEKILEIEADRFEHLKYSEGDFKTEARAVLGEYNKNSANPVQKLIEVQRNAAFTTHPYKHTTMGFLADIENMPNQYEYSKAFFDRWYRPEKTTIIVAGDVEAAPVFALVEKYWGGWERGAYRATIPQEPPAAGPVYAHVAWSSPTLPMVTVAFHGPSFFQTVDQAAFDTMLDLSFGETSELYRRLVEDERKVDQLAYFGGPNVDPTLFTVLARVKSPADAVYVRDQIVNTFASLRSTPLDAVRLADAKSNARYGFVRTLDNTEAIASTLAGYAQFERSYDTIDRYFSALSTVTPAVVQDVARRYVTDRNMVVATLSQQALAPEMAHPPSVEAAGTAPARETASVAAGPDVVEQHSVLPNVMVTLTFTTGAAGDPKGQEGLAALSAAMIADAGSRQMTIGAINKALYPMAGSFSGFVDKEMTTFTGVVHKDKLDAFLPVVLPQLLTPGFREDDFQRLKDQQLNALVQDLRSNNDELLGREALQDLAYAGTPYGHTTLGTVAALQAITLDDVKAFVGRAYKTSNLVIGVSGDYPATFVAKLKTDLAALGTGLPVTTLRAATPHPVSPAPIDGLRVEIIEKPTAATAISLGHPLPITRADPDFAALNLARVWLGEHRASSGRLFERLREVRGLTYGAYAYIEFFNRPGAQFFPSPNIPRRSQLFELWIRPVVPANAPMALKIALFETQQMIERGLTEEQFETTRDYLMKNVYLMTATQRQQLGYAVDSWWYGIPEYVSYMRAQYAKLTRDDVNRAIRKYLSVKNMDVVMVTKDAEGLRRQLLSSEPSTITYDAPKPELAAEDRIIGAYQLGLTSDRVTVVDVNRVFAE